MKSQDGLFNPSLTRIPPTRHLYLQLWFLPQLVFSLTDAITIVFTIQEYMSNLYITVVEITRRSEFPSVGNTLTTIFCEKCNLN